MSQECGVDLAVCVFSAGKGVGWGLSSAPVCDSVSLTLSVCLSLPTWTLIVVAGPLVGLALSTVQLPEMLCFFHGSGHPVVGETLANK